MWKYKLFSFALILSLISFLGACGEVEEEGEETRQGPGDGYTSCGTFGSAVRYCDPNTYCSEATFNTCTTGCLNNDNCRDGQSCRKESGDSVGICGDSEVVSNQTNSNQTNSNQCNASYCAPGSDGVCCPYESCLDDCEADCSDDDDACFDACYSSCGVSQACINGEVNLEQCIFDNSCYDEVFSEDPTAFRRCMETHCCSQLELIVGSTN